MSQPQATVSVDVDPVDLHLEAYGARSVAPDPLVYEAALPRLLERLAAHGLRATFFVVARDAGARGTALAGLAASGHEVASHSLTHPMAFAALPAARRREELAGSRAALERACGMGVVGFRAPNFDIRASQLGQLAEAGYRYDASGYPTPMLLPARLVLAFRSRDPAAVLRLGLLPSSLERRPRRVRTAAGEIVTFPASVTPVVRWPVYHTLRYLDSPQRFLARVEGFAGRGESLSYTLHAVDALGLREDQVDPRLSGHPGMGWPLAAKLEALDQALGAIAARYEVRPFRERVDAVPA